MTTKRKPTAKKRGGNLFDEYPEGVDETPDEPSALFRIYQTPMERVDGRLPDIEYFNENDLGGDPEVDG